MFFNMFYPLIEFLIFWPIRLLKRAWDKRNCSCISSNKKKTNAATIYEYESIYSGPIFEIHWKYAYILNVVYVTCLFGPGLPVLFPIAFISLCMLYIVEKFSLAYVYLKPPMYDESINKTLLKILSVAPWIYVINAIYLYSNPQVF